jgi:alpha/beta hydrolase family protein
MCALIIAGIAVPMAGWSEQPASAPIPVPTANGPVVKQGSHPFLAASHDLPPLDLSISGYVEEEYTIGGTGNVYDWGGDGTVIVKTPSVAYLSRILVRRPADRRRFSGAVVVELLYPARRWDWSMMWGYTHEQILERGDAWVGITLPNSVGGLKRFDPVRYGSLSFKNPSPGAPCPGAPNNTAPEIEDGLKWDLISQVGALLKANSPGTPFAGFNVRALYLTTQGGDLVTYFKAIHSNARLATGAPVYDGGVLKAPFTTSRINPCSPALPADDPRQKLDRLGVPVIAVAAEGEVLGTYASRRPDSDEIGDRYRLYEVAGAGHIDKSAYFGFPSMADQMAAGNALGTPAWPFAAPCEPEIPLMDTPIMSIAFDTAFAVLDDWVRKGKPAPRAPRIEVKNAGTPQASIVADRLGHGVGGVRTPFIDVPAATYSTNSTGPGTCREMGHKVPFDAARFASVYSSEKVYRDQVSASIEKLVKERWLTPGDARRVKAELNHNGRSD